MLAASLDRLMRYILNVSVYGVKRIVVALHRRGRLWPITAADGGGSLTVPAASLKGASVAKPFEAGPPGWSQDWEVNFLERLNQDRTAERVWAKIKKEGLADAAKFVLYRYAVKVADDIEKGRRGGHLLSRNLKAARRAVQVADARSSDPRAAMFDARRTIQTETAAKTKWPFNNPHVRTLADAAVRYPEIGSLILEQASSAIADAADVLRRYGPKMELAALEAIASSYSVELSARSLVALAWCAEPCHPLDERSVRRFLRDKTIRQARPNYVASFAADHGALLPSPAKR